MDLENVEATINLGDYSEEDLQQLISGMINDHPLLENILTNIITSKRVPEDHAYHAPHFEKSSNMEKNEEKPCSTIISESEQKISSPSPISSILDKINLEDLISEVLNPEDPTFKFLKKIKGGFLENHKMAYFEDWKCEDARLQELLIMPIESYIKDCPDGVWICKKSMRL